MNPEFLSFFLLLIGLVAGVALGWFLGNRPVGDWKARFAARDLDARDLDEKFRRAITDLAATAERAQRADELAQRLEQAQAARDQVLREKGAIAEELAALKADAANFAEQKRLLLEAQEALRKEFENAGNRVLEKAQETFLARAQERFSQSEEKNAERIRTLLAPVGERLKSYEQQVETLEKQRSDAFNQLYGQISLLREGQEKVREEAARLGNSLRNAPKTRGRWGEQQLRNVLEQCGLTEHTDFVTEKSVETADGRLRPDAIVRIPGNKVLVVDAKVSLNAYQDAFDADTDDQRKKFLDQHVASMRNHVQILAGKDYQSQFEGSPDYVIMFVPGEQFISAALDHESSKDSSNLAEDSLIRRKDLWNYAFDQRVIIASPANLVAICRTVSQVWQQDGLAREAREIGRLGTEIYDRIAIAGEHLKGVGAGLDRAVRKYNDFVGSFERNVASAGRKLRDKGITIGKREIEEVPLVEAQPRYADPAEPTIEREALPIPETE